jgi:hypothetical protein
VLPVLSSGGGGGVGGCRRIKEEARKRAGRGKLFAAIEKERRQRKGTLFSAVVVTAAKVPSPTRGGKRQRLRENLNYLFKENIKKIIKNKNKMRKYLK